MADELRYIVRRFNWKTTYNRDQLRQAPGDHRVAWFDTEADAVAECARREADVRGRVNPFHCGPSFHYLSTFPLFAFKDWLLDTGVHPPDGDSLEVWAKWWLTLDDPSHRVRVWEGLNRVRFHDVIARRPSEVAFAVVQVLWDYQDDFYSPGEEGGRIVTVYRTRVKAERECVVMNQRQQAVWARDEYGRGFQCYRDRWEETPWPSVRHGHQHDASACPMYEVIEIDLGGQTQ